MFGLISVQCCIFAVVLGIINWPRTPAGVTARVECPHGFTPAAMDNFLNGNRVSFIAFVTYLHEINYVCNVSMRRLSVSLSLFDRKTLLMYIVMGHKALAMSHVSVCLGVPGCLETV